MIASQLFVEGDEFVDVAVDAKKVSLFVWLLQWPPRCLRGPGTLLVQEGDGLQDVWGAASMSKPAKQRYKELLYLAWGSGLNRTPGPNKSVRAPGYN